MDNGIPPHLLTHDAQNPGTDCQHVYRVEHRHVVADNDAATPEVLVMFIAYDRLYTPDVVDVRQHGLVYHSVEPSLTALLVPRQQSGHEAKQTTIAQLEQVHYCAVAGADKLFDGHRHVAPMAIGIDNPVEYQRRHYPCHEYDGQHADDGYLGQRVECRMLGDNQ